MTTGQALRAVAKRGLEILASNVQALAAGSPGTEHVHQARVALRRIRSAIRLFDPDGADFPAKQVRAIRRLARTLGDTRDWDVLVDKTLRSILAAVEGEMEAKRGLLKHARRQREAAVEAAIDAVGDRGLKRLANALGQWCASPTPPCPPVADVVPARLDALADTVSAGAAAFPDLSTRGRHRVRIEVKRLRYAIDLLRSALPGEAADAYVDALAALQDTLGALNDAAVAREKLGRAVRRPHERHLVKAWYAEVEPELAARAARELRELARRTRPWSRTARARG